MRIRGRWVAVASAGLGAFLSAAVSLAQVGAPLTSQQVACEARQLRRLESRTVAPQSESTIFLWRSTPAGGVYQGAVISTSITRARPSNRFQRFEKQLAFDLILREGEDFLDPRRTLLPQATLVRREAATNFDERTDSQKLDLTLDLAPQVPNPYSPTLPVRIDVRREGRGQDDGAGRGITIEDLATPCHGEVTAFDRQVFSILARTLRGTYCYSGPVACGIDSLGFRAILYRGEEPLIYRAEFFQYSQSGDENGIHYGEAQTTLEFRLQVSAEGRLTGGDVRILPLCEPGQTEGCSSFFNPSIALFVLPPIRAGVERQDASVFRRGAYLFVDFFGSGNEVLSAIVNWADLLRGTAWGAP